MSHTYLPTFFNWHASLKCRRALTVGSQHMSQSGESVLNYSFGATSLSAGTHDTWWHLSCPYFLSPKKLHLVGLHPPHDQDTCQNLGESGHISAGTLPFKILHMSRLASIHIWCIVAPPCVMWFTKMCVSIDTSHIEC